MGGYGITVERVENSHDPSGPLSIYIRVPDDAPREAVEDAIVAFVKSLDERYRELGGDGLKLDSVRVWGTEVGNA